MFSLPELWADPAELVSPATRALLRLVWRLETSAR